jgi:hypothetical protein
MDNRTLTVEEMARILHIRPTTMHSKRWQKRTGCPLIKVSKRLISEEDMFNRWLKDKASNG